MFLGSAMNADEMLVTALCSLLDCIRGLISVRPVLHVQSQVITQFSTTVAASQIQANRLCWEELYISAWCASFAEVCHLCSIQRTADASNTLIPAC